MSEDLEKRIADERLFEFICAVSDCIFETDAFRVDERYRKAVAELKKLPCPTLLKYACILRDRVASAPDKKKWERIYERFGYEFGTQIIPF
jgi:hypothetical protein